MNPIDLGRELMALESRCIAEGMNAVQIRKEKDKFLSGMKINELKEKIKAENGGAEPTDAEIAKSIAAGMSLA